MVGSAVLLAAVWLAGWLIEREREREEAEDTTTVGISSRKGSVAIHNRVTRRHDRRAGAAGTVLQGLVLLLLDSKVTTTT